MSADASLRSSTRSGLRADGAFKRILPSGLYGRSLIIIVAPMVILQIVVTYVFLERHWQMVTEKLSRAVVADIALLLEASRQFPIEPGAPRLTALASSQLDLSVAFRDGETLPETLPRERSTLLARSLSEEIETQIGRPYWIDTDLYDDYVDIRIAVNGGVMRTLALRSRVYATNSHIFLVWMAGTSLVLVIVAIVFLRNQIRPIQRLAMAAESFGMGRDVPEFKPTGASEVRRAAAAFLRMRERIQRQIDQRTAMLAGVSHDLRTPLTRFKLQLALLDDGPETEELGADVREMERMLEEYLDFARGHQGETTELTDVAQLLEEIRTDASRNGFDVALDMEGNLMVPLRRNAFKRCVTNLVDNATKYATHVLVHAVGSNRALDITIDDDGEGIPEDQLEEVFRPFYRLDAARNLDTAGTGLGLAIARDVARGHGGDIRLSRSPRGGLRAWIHIPA